MMAQKRAWHSTLYVNHAQGSTGRSKLSYLGKIQDTLENAEAIKVTRDGGNHQITACTDNGYENERGNSGNIPKRILKPNPNDNFALKQGWKNVRLGNIK